MTNFEKVLEFQKAFKSYVGKANEDLSNRDLMKLRMTLIEEEYNEMLEAVIKEDKANLVKELCDILVVTYGFLVVLGIDADKAFDLVHKANMSKLDENGQPIFREDGKVLKGPNYKPVDESKLLIPL